MFQTDDLMKFENIYNAKEICLFIKRFDCIFPHLKEKIDSYESYSKKLEKYASVVISKINDELCGILIYYANNMESKTAYISLIGVFPNYQGRGLGELLLDYCIENSRLNGMKRLSLEVDLDNSSAISFYKRNGFIECGSKSTTSIQMTKDI